MRNLNLQYLSSIKVAVKEVIPVNITRSCKFRESCLHIKYSQHQHLQVAGRKLRRVTAGTDNVMDFADHQNSTGKR